MKKITVYCGENITSKCGSQLHPVAEVIKANILVNSDKDEVIYSNSPDCVSAVKYIGNKKGIQIEFFLNGVSHGDDIDPIFGNFNKALDLLNELSKSE